MELKNVEIISIGELKTFDSGFCLVTFVVKTDEQYPQFLELQANKEKAENLIKFNKVGHKVDVSLNLRGRQWTNPEGVVKTFNTLEAWKVFKADLSDDNMKKAVDVIDGAFPPLEEPIKDDELNDLPF
jgi:hypothetical protein